MFIIWIFFLGRYEFKVITEFFFSDITPKGIESLHIRNATFKSFNLNDIQSVLRIRYVTITDGNISRIEGEFPKHSKVQCLNLSSNHINDIEDRALAPLYTLNILDLSFNNLTEVPSIRRGSSGSSVTLDISSKGFWNY